MNRLSHLGVTSDMPPALAKRIVLTNRLGLLFAANMLVSALAFLYFEQYRLALFTLFFVLTEISWLFFNRFGHYNISRVGMLVSSNLLGLSVSVLLPDTGYNRGFYVMAGLPILLFGLKERGFIILGLLLPMALYPFSEWAQYHVPITLGLSPGATETIHYSIGVIYVLLIFLMFLFLSSENHKAEERLEEQRTRAFSSAKFAALGEMAGGIGHEINNPMMAIDLNAEHLKRILERPDLDKAKAIEKIDSIKRTIHRVANIVDAMRTFSRESSNDPLVDAALATIVHDTLTFCSERFRHHNIRLETVLPPKSCCCVAARFRSRRSFSTC